MLDAYLNTAIEAAKIAAGIHQYYQARGFESRSKTTASDVVTQADQDSEQAIRAHILERFPTHSILGEEEGQIGEGNYRWIVDPLDGTTNYAHGFPFYAVSIALEIDGRIQVGVVMDTSRNELFTATLNGGAYLNGQRIQVSAVDELPRALLATGFPYNVSQDQENLEYFKRALAHGLTVRRPGAAALDLAYVAAGRLDGFWETKLRPWDVAAGLLLITEAGGTISTLEGGAYQLGERYLAVSNTSLHAAMLSMLAGS